MNPRPRTLVFVLGGVVAAAAALAVVLVVLSRSGGDTSAVTTVTGPAPARSALFAGIPQSGITLGDPSAPELAEFADLQCPYCGMMARDALPTIVQRYVRTGKAKLVFRGMAFVGQDSVTALRAVEAAGLQNRLWDVVDAFYAAQGEENSGWVTDDLIRQIGASTPGLDVDRWLQDAESPEVAARMQESQNVASQAGVNSTPTLLLAGTPIELSAFTPAAVRQAIDPLLAE
jgi:protein-disulfide isomerase